MALSTLTNRMHRDLHKIIRQIEKHSAVLNEFNNLHPNETPEERQQRYDAARAQALEAEKTRLKNEHVAADADYEYRIEVIDAMVAAGVARHVAAELTNTEAKMLAQAKKYNV